MRPPVIVLVDELVQITWQLLERVVQRLPKGDAIELVEHGLAKAFADAVGCGLLVSVRV